MNIIISHFRKKIRLIIITYPLEYRRCFKKITEHVHYYKNYTLKEKQLVRMCLISEN